MIDVHRLFDRWQLDKVREANERSGRELYACCPFHGETTPSFSVNIETGKWYCFTCHEGGREIESLVAKMEGLSTSDEVSLFMREYGTVTTSEAVSKMKAKLAEKKQRKLAEPDSTSDDSYKGFLRGEPKYLYQRGFDSGIVRAHKIGYDPARQAIVIPVFEHGTCRFSYTRTTTNRKRAKYLYPSNVDRARYFWGLDQPERHYDGSTIILNEGGLDSLWLRQQGYPDALGILGSHLSQLQIEKLKKLNPARIILFFDNDDAGFEATVDAAKRLLAAGFTKVYFVRYRRDQEGMDPQGMTKQQIDRRMAKIKHVRYLLLKQKFGRHPRIRRVLAKVS